MTDNEPILCVFCEGTGRVGNVTRWSPWQIPKCPHCDGTGRAVP